MYEFTTGQVEVMHANILAYRTGDSPVNREPIALNMTSLQITRLWQPMKCRSTQSVYTLRCRNDGLLVVCSSRIDTVDIIIGSSSHNPVVGTQGEP
jgi:hypothetical protein